MGGIADILRPLVGSARTERPLDRPWALLVLTSRANRLELK